MRIVAACLTLFACTKETTSSSGATRSVSSVASTSSATSKTDPRPYLVLESQNYRQPTAKYLFVDKALAKEVGRFSIKAAPYRGLYQGISTVTAGYLVTAYADKPARTDVPINWQIEFRDSTGAVKRTLEIQAKSIGDMYEVNNQLFVGTDAAVGYFDLAQANPKPTLVRQRKNMMFKAYDVFDHDDDQLLAVDDIMMPFWADRIQLGKTPRAVADWQMPPRINGSYRDAAIKKNGSGGTIWTLSYGGGMSGSTQYVERMTYGGEELSNPVTLAREFADRRGPTAQGTTLFGKEYTMWTGMVLHRDSSAVFVAAGARGLMRVDSSWSNVSTLPADDVQIDGDTLYTVSADKEATIIRRFKVDGARLVEVKSLRLSGVYKRFAR